LFRRRATVIGGGSAKRIDGGSSKEAAQPDASLAQIARRYGIARRVLCRWMNEDVQDLAFAAHGTPDVQLSAVETPL
jgi:hypothetical protein